jgi:hypothetical protein
MITPRLLSLGLAALAAGAALLGARPCQACAECGCGDPTLTVLGSEKPVRHRLRGGATFTLQSAESGVAAEALSLAEKRLDLAAAWAPLDRLFLVASVPLVRRSLAYADGSREEIDGLGDFELRAKAFVWEDRRFSPRHLVALTAGARAPLASWRRDPAGTPVASERHLGSGALSPIVGGSYAYFRLPWAGYVSLEASTPVLHHDWYRPAPGLRATLAGQRQLSNFLALQLGVDARADGHPEEPAHAEAAQGSYVYHPEGGDHGAEHQAEPPEHEHGGAALFASAAVLVTPLPDLVAFLQLRLPALERLHDGQRNGAILATGLVYDF